MPRAKEFFWQDKSGRDGNNTFNLTQVRESFKGEKDWTTGQYVVRWAVTANVGDIWENAANRITRTK